MHELLDAFRGWFGHAVTPRIEAFEIAIPLLTLLIGAAALGFPDWLAWVGYASPLLLAIVFGPSILLLRRRRAVRALARRGITVTAIRTDVRLEGGPAINTGSFLSAALSVISTGRAGEQFGEWCAYYSYEYGGQHVVKSCSAAQRWADLGGKAFVLLDPVRPARRVMLRIAL